MVDMADIVSHEEIGKSTNDKNDKEQQKTMKIRDNHEQKNTIEISYNSVTEKTQLNILMTLYP